MLIYQVAIKHLISIETNPKIDVRLFLLSCLRISAVIHDNEIKLDDYTKVYYDSIKAEEKEKADRMAK